jgi:hypothetical protein
MGTAQGYTATRTEVNAQDRAAAYAADTSAGPAAFRVSEWRPYIKNTLRAFVTFQLPSHMVVRDCTLHAKGEARWVGLPARPIVKDGAIVSWAPVVDFNDHEARARFQKLALEAIDRYLAANGGAR